MRTHMYAYGYRNLELALATHGTIPVGGGLAHAGTARPARCAAAAASTSPDGWPACRAIAPAYA